MYAAKGLLAPILMGLEAHDDAARERILGGECEHRRETLGEYTTI